MMYEELVNSLREEAGEWCTNCCYKCGDNVCGAPDYRKKNCEVYTKLHAADAFEELTRENESLAKSVNEASEILRRRWIPVTERLPEYDTNCIVFSGGEVKEAHFYYGKFYDPIEDYMRYNATHWMPLPSPPVEE